MWPVEPLLISWQHQLCVSVELCKSWLCNIFFSLSSYRKATKPAAESARIERRSRRRRTRRTRRTRRKGGGGVGGKNGRIVTFIRIYFVSYYMAQGLNKRDRPGCETATVNLDIQAKAAAASSSIHGGRGRSNLGCGGAHTDSSSSSCRLYVEWWSACLAGFSPLSPDRRRPNLLWPQTPIFGGNLPRAIGLHMETGDQNFRKKENLSGWFHLLLL